MPKTKSAILQTKELTNKIQFYIGIHPSEVKIVTLNISPCPNMYYIYIIYVLYYITEVCQKFQVSSLNALCSLYLRNQVNDKLDVGILNIEAILEAHLPCLFGIWAG